MKTILAAVDFSPVSKLVIKEAAALARALGGRVVLMNVTQPPAVPADFYSLVVDSITAIAQAAEVHARQHLVRLRKPLERAAIPTEIIQETGDPVTLILDRARALPADYIVMGSHGHTAFYALFAGSVASGVLHGASGPVVVVPPARRAGRR